MERRIKKVNELLKREISQAVLNEVDFPKDILVTVTRVETSVDLEQSRVFISVMPEGKTSLVLSILNRAIYNLQQRINKRLKMRIVPKISFFKEKKTRKAAKVEEILERLKKEGEKDTI